MNNRCAGVVVVVVLALYLLPHAVTFTVITSDSSTLVDGPQTAFPMGRTSRAEQKAVYDIMRATGNDWATDIPDVCRGRWHGIECMPDKDNVFHVVSLSFGELSEDTAFPTCHPTRSFLSPSITKLPHLKTLFFYRCFTYNPQPIPPFLGLLGPSLQTLVLRENSHFGPIPLQFANLTRLRVLDLHKNNLNGSIPFSLGRITGLRSLDLSSNKLTGSIPAFSFPSLNVLDFSQNLLRGPIPSALYDSRSLVKLDLSRNHLVGPLPGKLTGLKELVLLDLSYNRIQGPFPGSLRGLVSLQALILKGNPMGSTVVDGFDGMKALMIVILSNMNLHGPVPESLGRIANIRVVHLDGNHLNGSIPKSYGRMRRVSELRLNDNGLSGVVPFDREMVWRMKRKLRLNNNSGLCYDASSGLGDSTFDLGISLCDTCYSSSSSSSSSSPGSVRTVQHVSAMHKSLPTHATSDALTRSLGVPLATFLLLPIILL